MEETIKPIYYYSGCSVKVKVTVTVGLLYFTILHVKLRGLPLLSLNLVTSYCPLNPEPSLLSKWSCNDVCIQSGNTRQKKYETSNKCCGCPVSSQQCSCHPGNYLQKDVHKASFVEQMNAMIMSKW